MKLARLPSRIADAPTNMAIDLWMLSKTGSERGVLYRNYGWARPAFTFGYTQKWADVSPRLPLQSVEYCRRPSGGGIVDHRNDWTYALAISAACPLGKYSPLDLYRNIHSMLSECFREWGINSDLFEEYPSSANPVACFERPSPHDVVFKGTTRKIAGAALKRTKAGVLLQGSVDRTAISEIRLDEFEDQFLGKLIRLGTFDAEVESVEFLESPDDIPGIGQFRNKAWNDRR